MAGRSPDDTDPAEPSVVDSGPGPGAAGEPRQGPRQVRTGDTLGRYEIGEELGEGGMATVFRARDRELRRDVALKVLFPHLARRPEIVRRFHREARAAAGLEHPNILRVYDVGGGERDDPPYIVMELVRGRTLLQEIEQRGAMLAEVAAGIGALLGDALAAAHAAGIVHRDVKPANVLIAPGGRVLLADFGVARLETEDSLVTRTGALLGTPAYMSPEQAGGDTATARSDLYSLGATLYQLATGALPYSGAPAKVMSMIALGNLVAPVRRRPACGPDLSRLIERMMATDPAARPARATAIAGELRALAAAGGLGDATDELAAYFADPDGFLRSRTPTVVASLVTAARSALAEARLPRAMALTDRASALAPADPAVGALVRDVTEGGQASRRNRRLAIGGIAVVLAGGATVLGRSWFAPAPAASSPSPPAARDASPVSQVATDERVLDARAPGDPPDAGAADAASAVAIRPIPIDAGVRRERTMAAPLDARARAAIAVVDATVEATPADAAPVDAHVPELEAAPEPARGFIQVSNRVWCEIWIDGVDRGNTRNVPLEVAPGHHVVRCANPGGEWTQQVDVPAGATRTVTGTLLRDLEVRLAIDATIDGTHHARGSVVRLKPGVMEVIAGGKKQFITFRVNCALSDVPELGCYP